MKQVVVKKVSASGFLSIADSVTLPIESGITIVTGENLDDSDADEDRSNGSGKTTLVGSAIEFAFYGTAKGTRKSEIPFWGVAKPRCNVVTEFDVIDPGSTKTYSLTRSINPSKVMLRDMTAPITEDADGKPGKNLSKDSAATQATIERIIGIPQHVYDQCICLKVNDKQSKFLQLSKSDREKFVNVVFDLSKFKDMEKLVRADYNEGVKNLDKVEAVQLQINSKRTTLEDQVRRAEAEIAAKVEKLEGEKVAAEEALKRAKKDASDRVDKLDAAYDKAATELFESTQADDEDKARLVDTLGNWEVAHADLTTKLMDLPDPEKDRVDVLGKMDTVVETRSKSTEVVGDCRREIVAGDAKMKSLKNDSACPTCKRPMDGFSEDAFETTVAEWTESRESLEKIIETHASKIETSKKIEAILGVQIDDINTRVDDIRSLERKIERASDEVENYRKKIENFEPVRTRASERALKQAETARADFDETEIVNFRQAAVVKIEDRIKDTANDETVKRLQTALTVVEGEVVAIVEERKKLLDEVEVLRYLRHASGEEGVRKFILDKLIKLFNQRLGYFLEKFQVPFTMTFDGAFNPEIKNTDERIIDYANMSGGEQKRVDMAVSFTFKDILRAQNQIRFNFCIYDEIFDTSLDGVGQEKILDYLREEVVANGDAVYIITNSKNFIVEGAKSIHMVKKDKKSTMTIL